MSSLRISAFSALKGYLNAETAEISYTHSYWLSTRPSITACMPDDTLEKKSKPEIAST